MADGGSNSQRVLILAPIGRDGPTAAAVLQDAGLIAQVCRGPEELLRDLHAGAAAALVAEEAFVQGPLEAIVEWVKGQPSWSDFPFVLLTGSRAFLPERTRRIRFLEALQNVSLLERPVHTVTLLSAVYAALRARRRQYETRAYLLEREQAATRLEELIAERTHDLEESNRRLQAEIVERQQAEAALLHAQKMEAIGRLTGGVAHDFNNLLTAVLGNLELARARVTSETIQCLLHSAERAAGRGAKLTEQLLAFSRKQQLNLESVDLNALVSGMGDLLFRTIGSTVRIETLLEKDLWPAVVDVSQIQLVILNLAINGRDAMPRGGRLTIETANVGAGDPALPHHVQRGDYVAIYVRDTGVGMTEEVRTKAFEPFFTTKEIGQGTGLGLSQVYGVAQQSGGTVHIDSRLGGGTTVTVYLPRAETAALPQRQEEPAIAKHSLRSEAILVVDDDEDVRAVTVATLESLGYAVTPIESGRSALDALTNGLRPDLILLDYLMPDMNGIDTLREIRRKWPHIRFLMMTGYADSDAISAEAGREKILKKPFTVVELASMIETALGPVPLARPQS